MTHQTTHSLPGKRHTGFSLVEIMVALVIGLLLILGVTQVYLSSKASYRTNDGLARVQETGRFATNLISRNIRMAGYLSCPKLDQEHIEWSVPNNPPWQSHFSSNISEMVINGVDEVNASTGDSKPKPIATIPTDAAGESDSLTVAYASPDPVTLSSMPRSDKIILDNSTADIRENGLAIVTNCEHADIAWVKNISSDNKTIKLRNELSKSYGSDAHVARFHFQRYYVRQNPGRQNSAGDSVFTLYEQYPQWGATGNLTTRPLVDGVEAIEIQYGEGSNNATSVTDFSDGANNVIDRVRVALVVNSVESSLTESGPARYTLPLAQEGGNDVKYPDAGAPALNDRLLRKVFSFTATIRNRALPYEGS